jgi:hypothetical protein
MSKINQRQDGKTPTATSVKHNKRLISKRPKLNAFSSGSEVEDEGDDTNDNQAMLAALQAHGRAMFGGLDDEDSPAESSAQAQRRASMSQVSSTGSEEEEDGEGFSSDDGWGAEDGFVSDSEDELVQTRPVNQQAQSPGPSRSCGKRWQLTPSSQWLSLQYQKWCSHRRQELVIPHYLEQIVVNSWYVCLCDCIAGTD